MSDLLKLCGELEEYFGGVKSHRYSQALRLIEAARVMHEALKEKAALEPGPRMYENSAAAIALVEADRIARGEK